MFDRSLPEIGDLTAVDDAALVDAAGGWSRTENAACARKLAVMAELFARRTGLPAGEREDWWVDPEAAVGAELGATQNISAWMALAQTHRGVVLADRLPKIAALFEAGLISEVLVRAIKYRTALVTDAEAIARVDALLAEQVKAWGPMSVRKTERAIDAIVDRVDPGALRRSRKATCDRDVQFGSPSDEAGFTSKWARLYAPDAVVLKQRVEEMARGVCEDDPRTLGERRSEALAAVAAGIAELACDCGSTDCAAAERDASPPATAVIHVVADAATVEAAHAETTRTTPPPSEAAAAADPAPVVQDPAPAEPDMDAATPALCSAPPALVIGAGVMPAPLLAATLQRAKLRQIRHPGDAPPEPHYRPSRALADFVHCRDLACRWPGCDKPAYDCDIDHTVPWPVGPTHASNTKCYCRFHHLLKTLYCGIGGRREQQLADGTLTSTSPTGHTYTTKPGCAQLFPTLCQPTATRWPPGDEPTMPSSGDRGLMMPKRRRTRAENSAVSKLNVGSTTTTSPSATSDHPSR
jgi:hypothetical protein